MHVNGRARLCGALPEHTVSHFFVFLLFVFFYSLSESNDCWTVASVKGKPKQVLCSFLFPAWRFFLSFATMTTYWKSTPKHFCKYCNCWLTDSKSVRLSSVFCVCCHVVLTKARLLRQAKCSSICF